MNADETRQTLRVLAAAYPPVVISAETVAVWASVTTHVDPREALDVAVAWVETEARFPVVSTFLEACQAAARKRAALVAQQERERGALPPGAQPIDQERSVRAIRLLREAMADRASFSDAEFMQRVVDADATSPTATVRCRECDDSEWVEERGRVRPCSRCQPEHHTLWRNGHYEPNHHPCEICRPSRRRRRAD